MENYVFKKLTWDIKVPNLKNRIIVKQLCIAIGLPFGALILFLLMIQAYYGLVLLGVTFILAYLLILAVFRGTYDIRYEVNAKGILCENQPLQAKRVKVLSFMTALAGILSSNPTASGAGILSGLRTEVFIPWGQIRKVKYIEKQKCIMLYAGITENITVFCTDDNFFLMKDFLTEKLSEEIL